jgi:RNA polymerase sigma-70 factor, ECF subfamily
MAEGGQQNIVALRAEDRFRVIGSEGLPLVEWSDEALMLAHGKGSEAAFELLVSRHQKPILNYLFRMLRNRQVAEELSQEVFLALVRNAQRYQPTAKFTTYLYTIASNMVSKEWAKQRRRPKCFSLSAWWSQNKEDDFDPLEHFGDPKADTVQHFQRGEISDAVNEALRLLPAHQQEAFVLLRFQELAYHEIAEIVGAPVGTVKSRVVRAERALRPHLERFREYL